jgi:hypothetical protein
LQLPSSLSGQIKFKVLKTFPIEKQFDVEGSQEDKTGIILRNIGKNERCTELSFVSLGNAYCYIAYSIREINMVRKI